MLKKISCLVLLCWSLRSFALTPVTLALDWYINPDHAPILAAETQGYFKQNGLDVTLLQPTETSVVRNLVTTGSATFGVDYGHQALFAIQKGLPLEIIGSLIPRPLGCLAVLKSSGITSLQGLKGKTVGYSGSVIEAELLAKEFRHAGLKPGDVTLVVINMDLSQALLSHVVDGVNGMMRNVEPVMLQMRGIQTTLFYPEQNGAPPYSELVFMAKNGENKATIAAFLKAVAAGTAYVKAHPEASWQNAETAYPDELASSAEIAKENQTIWLATVPYF